VALETKRIETKRTKQYRTVQFSKVRKFSAIQYLFYALEVGQSLFVRGGAGVGQQNYNTMNTDLQITPMNRQVIKPGLEIENDPSKKETDNFLMF
jgi:hypothetical protein